MFQLLRLLKSFDYEKYLTFTKVGCEQSRFTCLYTLLLPHHFEANPDIISSLDISEYICNISGYFSKPNQNTIVMTLKIGKIVLILSNSSAEIFLVA